MSDSDQQSRATSKDELAQNSVNRTGAPASISLINAAEFVPSSSTSTSQLSNAAGSVKGLERKDFPIRSYENEERGGTSSAVYAPSFVPKSHQSNPHAAAFVPSRKGTATSSSTHRYSYPTDEMRQGSIPLKSEHGEDSHRNLPGADEALGMSSGEIETSVDLALQAAQMFKEMNPFTNNTRIASASGSRISSNSSTPVLSSDIPPGLAGSQKSTQWNTDRQLAREHETSPAPSERMSGTGQAFNQKNYRNQPRRENMNRHFPISMNASNMQIHNESRGRGGRGRGRGRSGRGPNKGPYDAGTGQIGKFGPGFPGYNRPSVSAFAVAPGRMQLSSQFMSENLRADMQHRNFLSTAPADEETLSASGLPSYIHHYHTPMPLEDPIHAVSQPSLSLGCSSFVFRGIHDGDGASYALRRIDGNQAVPTAELLAIAEEKVGKWMTVSNHPNVVGLREVFVSDEIDATPSLFFSYDFCPGACSLYQAHMQPMNTSYDTIACVPASEKQIWTYIVQLASAIRAIHSAGLFVGAAALSATKVLIVQPLRIRLGAVGIEETLKNKVLPTDIAQAQRIDLEALGNLILLLACGAHNMQPNLDFVASQYSRELSHIIAGLIAAPTGSGFVSWRSLCAALGDRVFDEIDRSNTSVDTVAMELQKECENGRLARLLIKLCMVVERAEMLGDVRWSETGDRYLLKLFRDFVFHRVDENGTPRVDWGGIIEALNKADAGVEERIMLLNRDETSMLVVSYADVRRCLQMAYDEIKAASRSGGDTKNNHLHIV